MVVKTFRGLLADGGQDRIRLQTIKGKVGYQIKKYQLMINSPGGANSEHCVKIFKTKQSSITVAVDFTDSDLLAAGTASNTTSGYSQIYNPSTVIFDNQIINQDIYVTHFENHANEPVNYYLELEVIPLDDAGAEYTTLKDMRST